MKDKLKSIPWLTLLKGLAVLCAFLAFCISIRQKEFERFSAIKPIFEIQSVKEEKTFYLWNHGGTVSFLGCEGRFQLTPRQYTALPHGLDENLRMQFVLTDSNDNLETTFIYWRDTDLNTYKMKIGLNRGEYFIDGLPEVKRSKHFYTMSWHWLDGLFNCIFEKEWFKGNYELPKEDELVIVN